MHYLGKGTVNVLEFLKPRMLVVSIFIPLITIFIGIDTIKWASATDIGVAKNVINKVYGNTLSKGLRSGDKLIQNQRIRTSRDSAIDMKFLDNSLLYVGELSDLTLDNLINGVSGNGFTGALNFAKGIMRFVSGSVAELDFQVKTTQCTIGVRGTAFDVMASRGGTEVAVHEGAVQVDLPSGTKQVGAGQVYRISKTGEAGFRKSMSDQMRKSVSKMLRAIKGDGRRLSSSTLAKRRRDNNESALLDQLPGMKNAIVGKDLSNILFLDLIYGRVIIEMKPEIAPNHVKRIKELVRMKFYDGVIFHNVVAGFAAETGDPEGTGRGGSGKLLKAEVSGTPFVRGIVGMKRARNNLDSADSQFFILLGDAKHLEGQYTAWGRVIHGMELMDRMRKGSPPTDPDRIVKIRLAADTSN